MTGIWLRVQSWLALAGAVVLVLLGAYAMGGRAARRSVLAEEAANTRRTMKRLNELELEHDKTPTSTLRQRARERVQRDTER